MNSIKKIRERQGVSQLQLAEAAKRSVTSLWRYESEHREPRAGELIRIAKVLNCTVNDLLSEE